MNDIKLLINNVIEDSVTNLLYYDRKEDENLKVGDIEEAIKDNVVTIDEMVDMFRQSLLEGLS